MENTNRIFWEEKLAEWKSSGQEIHTWCKEQQLDMKKFNYWKNRLHENGEKAASPVFAEVFTYSSAQESRSGRDSSHLSQADNRLMLYCQGVRISVPDGFHPNTLLSLLRTLKRL